MEMNTKCVVWSEVPIDTEILVRDENETIWHRRNFAGYVEDTGKIKAFIDGCTSKNTVYCCYWDHAKLVADEENEERNGG